MSGSNCCFLTGIHISQEAGKLVWCSHLVRNFPQFVVIHTVKGFSVVNEAEVAVFLEFSCFFWFSRCWHLGVWFLCLSKSSLNIWKFSVHTLSTRSLENFEHYFASVWDECDGAVIWTLFGITFLWDWSENWPFPGLGHCWVFQICWHIKCSTFTTSSFRMWNSWAGIPTSPLVLFIVMLHKAHLTSHSRKAGSRWVITLLWLSGSWRSFLFSSSVYSWDLFLISYASVRSILFLQTSVWNIFRIFSSYLQLEQEVLKDFSSSCVFFFQDWYLGNYVFFH